MKKLLIFWLGWAAFVSATAQDTLPPPRLNVVQGTVGTIGILLSLNANYERVLKIKPNGYWGAKLGFGSYGDFDTRGKTYSLSSVWLKGSAANHLETGAGIMVYHEKDTGTYFWPDLHIGYRHQKPADPFVFRIGLGFPEGLYLGLGVAF